MQQVGKEELEVQKAVAIDSLIESCSRLAGRKNLTVQELDDVSRDFDTLMRAPGVFWGDTIPGGIYQMLRRRLYDLGFSEDQLKDLAQEILIKVFKKFPVIKRRAATGPPGTCLRILRGWLTVVCKHKIKDMYRMKQPRLNFVDSVEEFLKTQKQMATPLVSSDLDDAALERKLQQLSSALPPDLQQFLIESTQPPAPDTAILSSAEKVRKRRRIKKIKNIWLEKGERRVE